MRGTPSTSATMLTEKVLCSAVCLNRLFKITLALPSRLSSITNRVLSPADSSLMSAMPSISRALTNSWMRPATMPGEI